MGSIFGTDGVRGLANEGLSCELAYSLGQVGAYVLNHSKGERIRVLIGKDTRISGDMLEAALVAGICSTGADAIEMGIVPTPAIAYLIRYYNADAGIMISASHNSMEYNGIKFFDRNGHKLPDELEEKIEALITGGVDASILAIGDKIGKKSYCHKGARDYIDFIKSTVDIPLKGLRVALDCANGAAYETTPAIFRELGADVFVINAEPNGININNNCGSVYPEKLSEFVVDVKADIGLAFDGDADRLIAVDEEGNIVDGDQIMAICTAELRERGTLAKNTVVSTVMSNLGFDIAMERCGCNIVKTQVGDRYVLEKMLECGYNFGGEQSGHIIFLDHNTTGDGSLTGVQLVSIMKRRQQSLSQLAKVMEKLPQTLVNVEADEDAKKSYMDDLDISSAIEEIEGELKERGRLLIRPSGTEPLIRIMLEGEDQAQIDMYGENLAQLFREKLHIG